MSFRFLAACLLLLVSADVFTGRADAASSFEVDAIGSKHHVTADRTLYHSKEKVYEAFGHVVMSAKGRRLSADYAWIDTTSRELKAKGNVIFVDATTTIQAAEIHYNIDTGYGSIFYGKVTNDYYTLKGQLIRKVADKRFLTTQGEYTTCKDCAESWKLSSQHVDFTVDGYAFMDSVYLKIKDVPTLYLPYLIVPVKTKRQTGLLFTKLGTSERNGFSVVQPLFVAIDDHQDVTLGVGRYSKLGARYEFEHRYKSYNGIEGKLNLIRTHDRTSKVGIYRQSLQTENQWPFMKNFRMRWRIFEVNDRDHPVDFPEDIKGLYEPALESNAIAETPFNDFFLAAEAKRYRSLLYDQAKGFDGGMVQTLPTVHAGIKERRVFGPLLGSFYGRYDRFTRRNGPFDDINQNNIYDTSSVFNHSTNDTLREADRVILTPELSTPFRLGNYLHLTPSVQYNDVRYAFSLPTQNRNLENTRKSYTLGRLELSTTLNRVYDYNSEQVSRLKHQLSPFLTYNNILQIDEDKTHPFQNQLRRDDGLFDQYDIIPISNSTNFLRLPLGNSLYYGVTSRLIRKFRSPAETPKSYPYDLTPKTVKKKVPPRNRKEELAQEHDRLWELHNPRYGDYQEVWTVLMSQAYDFKEASHQRAAQSRGLSGDSKRAFSYLLAKSDFNIPEFGNTIEYRFFPRIVRSSPVDQNREDVFSNKHYFTTAATWYLKNMKDLRRTHSFVRSISFNFTSNSMPDLTRYVGSEVKWSLNDYFAVVVGYNYDLLNKHQLNVKYRTVFTHPSDCWRLSLRYDRSRSTKTDYGIDLGINLLGTGFVGVNEFGEEAPGGAGVFGGS